jgi:hypothetical protein
MENTDPQKTELAAQATASAAKRKQLETEFEQLKAIQDDLARIAALEKRTQEMKDDIAKTIAGTQAPK